MPRSQHDEIVAKFDEEKAKSEIVSTWLSGHPCPTWEHVLELLRLLEMYGRGRKGAADEVEERYLKSELYTLCNVMCVLCICIVYPSRLGKQCTHE